jgi:hypothetical protein
MPGVGHEDFEQTSDEEVIRWRWRVLRRRLSHVSVRL